MKGDKKTHFATEALLAFIADQVWGVNRIVLGLDMTIAVLCGRIKVSDR